MKSLIYSGVFCQDEENREMVRLWGRLVTHLNPDVDIVVFDSCSPFNPEYFLPDRIHIHRFGDNPGHLSRGGKDGAGRTFCAGIEYAAERGYDYCIHIESDLLLAKPATQIAEMMSAANVKYAACMLPQYQFPEFGICAIDVRYAQFSEFVERYDWENAPKWPIPERRIPELMGHDLWIMPWWGTRNDQGTLNRFNLRAAFPYAPPDFITRVNMDTALEFLAMNEIELPEL